MTQWLSAGMLSPWLLAQRGHCEDVGSCYELGAIYSEHLWTSLNPPSDHPYLANPFIFHYYFTASFLLRVYNCREMARRPVRLMHCPGPPQRYSFWWGFLGVQIAVQRYKSSRKKKRRIYQPLPTYCRCVNDCKWLNSWPTFSPSSACIPTEGCWERLWGALSWWLVVMLKSWWMLVVYPISKPILTGPHQKFHTTSYMKIKIHCILYNISGLAAAFFLYPVDILIWLLDYCQMIIRWFRWLSDDY